MKNLKMIKKLFILIMTIGLVIMFSNFVYAEDEDAFVSLTITNSTENNTNSNESNTSNSLLFYCALFLLSTVTYNKYYKQLQVINISIR